MVLNIHWVEIFYHKWMLNYFKSIFCVYWDHHMIFFFFFSLDMWCITLTDSWIMNHPCIPRVNSTCWLCMTLLMYYWSQFANILLRNLYPCSSVILACNFLFLCYFLFLDIFVCEPNMIVGSQNEFRSIPSSELFCNSWRIGVSFSLNVWLNLLVKLCGPDI